MSEPLISVVLATWNRAGLLAQAIASVEAQTYPHWELIVADDGSDDGTRALLKALPASRCRVVRLPHGGNPARARNAALALAAGDLVALLDDDDLWLPEKLAVQAAGMRQRGCRWSYTAFHRVDPTGTAIGGDRAAWRPLEGWILPQLLRLDAIVPLPTVMVERALLAEVGGFDESLVYCEDYDLWFRLGERAAVHAVDRPLAAVRVHPASHSANREAVHRAWVTVYEKALARAGDPAAAAICRTRRAHHLASLARHAASRGDRRAAMQLLVRSWPFLGANVYWWRSLARVLWPTR